MARINKKLYTHRPQILRALGEGSSAVDLAAKYKVDKNTMYKVLGEWGAVGKREEVDKNYPYNIINTAHTKGGAAKSTVAWNLAVALQGKGVKVSILDLDSQKSCYQLNMIRTVSPMVVMHIKDINELQLLVESIAKDEVLIIDEGGFNADLNTLAMSLADVVVTPLRDSIMDIMGLKVFEKVIDDAGNPKTKLLLNMIHPLQKDFSPFEDAVKSKLNLEILKTKFLQSSWFDIAHNQGKGVSEMNTNIKSEKAHLKRVKEDLNSLCFELLGV